jgi:hypothetical protein
MWKVSKGGLAELIHGQSLPNLKTRQSNQLCRHPRTRQLSEHNAIEGYYGTCSTPGSVASRIIASTTICRFRTEKFASLRSSFPVFAADFEGWIYSAGQRHKVKKN